MSYYENIYNDLPLRCARLWKKMRKQAEEQELDVTFMLMTAAAGFAAPFEHLKIQSGQAKDNRNHPAFKDFDESHYKKVLSMERPIASKRSKISWKPSFVREKA